MAKHYVTHSCGHKETHRLFGSGQERQVKYEETRLCFACYKAEAEKERMAQSDLARTAAAGLDFPALCGGTDKQNAWAERLRGDLLKTVEGDAKVTIEILFRKGVSTELKERLREAGQQLLADGKPTFSHESVWRAVQPLLYRWIGDKTESDWWIENRQYRGTPVHWLCGAQEGTESYLTRAAVDYKEALEALFAGLIRGAGELEETPETLLSTALGKQREIDAAKNEAQALRIAADQEATVLAEKTVSPLLAKIIVVDGKINVHYAEKNEALREIVRRLGFTWSGTCWTLATKSRDMPVEVAHRLLSARFSIYLADRELRERALKGDYKPYNSRRVFLKTQGDHKGWMGIVWGFEEDYYAAAKRLRGARWEKPYVVVPIENWEEVLGFARAHKFEVLQSAEGAIAEQKKRETEALRVSPSDLPVPTDLGPGGAPKAPAFIPVPSEIGIPSHLLDSEEGETP